jgi:hypothetical protein
VSAAHLVRRFFGSLRPGGPPAADVAWVGEQLLPAERSLWASMPGPDRRHSAGVARRVALALGPDASRPVLAAALLHDVGKTQVGLRTPGRVVATLLAGALGRERVAAWSTGRGYRSRLGRYVRHDELGAALLAEQGSDPLTVAWTREHHLPPGRWSLPRREADALQAADDD